MPGRCPRPAKPAARPTKARTTLVEMQNFLKVTGTVALLLLLLWWLAPSPPKPEALSGLPWQIETLDDGSIKVLGLHLGVDGLKEAIDIYGPPEGIAIFSPGPEPKDMSLEAYFGSTQNGPLAANVILTLDADQAKLITMSQRVTDRKPGTSGSWQWQLGHQDREVAQQLRIKSITYIPHYSKLDDEFFRQRFGEPERTLELSATSQRWLYPSKGLVILIDQKGKEVLQYLLPGDFAAWERGGLPGKPVPN